MQRKDRLVVGEGGAQQQHLYHHYNPLHLFIWSTTLLQTVFTAPRSP